MIELDLTKDNLQKCGFDDEEIVRLLEWDNYECFLNGRYFASNVENKIYPEIEGYKKHYFKNGSIAFPIDHPELIDEYFKLARNEYLEKQKDVLKLIYNEANQIKKFISIEITKTENSIDNVKAPMGKMLFFYDHQLKLNQISIYEAYVEYLKEKLNALPQQIKPEPLPILPQQANEFTNNFDLVSESKVLEYFTKELVDRKFLNADTLNEYLKVAFEKNDIPETRFSFDRMNNQSSIIKVFYNYFNIIAGKPHGKKLKYVKLLGEYFNGFDTEKIKTNFSK